MSKTNSKSLLKRRGTSFLFFFWLGLFVISPSLWAVDITESINKGLAYLASMQNDDGGFPSDKGRPSSPMVTDWVVMALRAADEDVTGANWSKNGVNPWTYLAKETRPLEGTTDYARTLLALNAVGNEPSYQGVDLAEKLASFQLPHGQFAQSAWGEEGLINCHIWSVLALVAVEKEIPHQERVLAWLVSQQNSDGGFSWVVGGESDPDDTGVALSALAVLGLTKEDVVIKKALQYLQEQQNKNGGFGWTKQKTNTATDAWVIQGLAAVGEDSTSDKWQVEGISPVVHLCSLQNSDGSFQWMQGVDSSPVLMTAYAVLALSGSSFPVNLTDKVALSLPNNLSREEKGEVAGQEEEFVLLLKKVSQNFRRLLQTLFIEQISNPFSYLLSPFLGGGIKN
ncbi:MAG: prenyltransferase/squalene oxidase repeat-containing protein [Peptococcia bacterium]